MCCEPEELKVSRDSSIEFEDDHLSVFHRLSQPGHITGVVAVEDWTKSSFSSCVPFSKQNPVTFITVYLFISQ